MRIRYAFARLLKHLRASTIQASTIHETARVGAASHVVGTHIGGYSYCGADCSIANAGIGNFTLVSDQDAIDGTTHAMDNVSTSPVFYAGRNPFRRVFRAARPPQTPHTVIGHDVWIGHSAKIASGVTIGGGAVIAMSTVITRHMVSYAIVGKAPAKFLTERFAPDITRVLAGLESWDSSEGFLRETAHLVYDTHTFIEACS